MYDRYPHPNLVKICVILRVNSNDVGRNCGEEKSNGKKCGERVQVVSESVAEKYREFDMCSVHSNLNLPVILKVEFDAKLRKSKSSVFTN